MYSFLQVIVGSFVGGVIGAVVGGVVAAGWMSFWESSVKSAERSGSPISFMLSVIQMAGAAAIFLGTTGTGLLIGASSSLISSIF